MGAVGSASLISRATACISRCSSETSPWSLKIPCRFASPFMSRKYASRGSPPSRLASLPLDRPSRYERTVSSRALALSRFRDARSSILRRSESNDSTCGPPPPWPPLRLLLDPAVRS